jgi:hypothetical protein
LPNSVLRHKKICKLLNVTLSTKFGHKYVAKISHVPCCARSYIVTSWSLTGLKGEWTCCNYINYNFSFAYPWVFIT